MELGPSARSQGVPSSPAGSSGTTRRRSASERAHVLFVREPRERCRAPCDRRRDETEEGRVVLHAIDEHEAPGVLELALYGHVVELATERARSPRRAPAAREVVEPRLDEARGRTPGSCRSGARRGRTRAGRAGRPGSRSSRWRRCPGAPSGCATGSRGGRSARDQPAIAARRRPAIASNAARSAARRRCRAPRGPTRGSGRISQRRRSSSNARARR